MRGERSKDIASSQAPALADLRLSSQPSVSSRAVLLPSYLTTSPPSLPHLLFFHPLLSACPLIVPLPRIPLCPTTSHLSLSYCLASHSHILFCPNVSHPSLSHCHIPPCPTVTSLLVTLSHPLHPFVDLHLPQYDTRTTLRPHDLV